MALTHTAHFAMLAASAALAAPAPPCAPAGFTPRVCGDLGDGAAPLPIPVPRQQDDAPMSKACHACRREDGPEV